MPSRKIQAEKGATAAAVQPVRRTKSKMKKKLNAGVLIVIAFLVVFVWWGTAEADTYMELGPSQVGSTLSTGAMLTISERINDKYDFTIGYITDQEFSLCSRPDCTWHTKAQIFAGAELLVKSPWTDKLRFSLGPYVFQRPDRVGTDTFRMSLKIEYRFNDRFGLSVRHFSLAGSGPEITLCRERVNWNTVPNDTPGAACQTNDWNTGQDSWLRLAYYF